MDAFDMPRIPASIRNKNPGAMWPGPSSIKFGATKHEVLISMYKGKKARNLIATFHSSVQGAAAQFDLLDRKYTGMKVKDAIARWCGGFYVNTYIGVMESKAGLSRNDILTKAIVRDPQKAIPLCKAMAFQEAGREYPMSDDDWSKAHEMAFPGEVAIIVPPRPEQKPEAANDDPPTAEQEFEPDNTVPAPKPPARVRQAAKESKTILGALAALFATIVQYFEQTAKAILEAASQVTDWTPASGFLSTLGANTKSVAFGMAVFALALVIFRRLDAAAKGKVG